MQVKGRHLVVAWMAVFLTVAGIIVIRDQRGFTAQKELRLLLLVADSLTAEWADLHNALGPMKRDELRTRAEALGLRAVSDSDLVFLPLSPDR